MQNKQLNDKLTTITMESLAPVGSVPMKSPFRTEISATDEFGDVLFTLEHNMVVLGGAITVLEKLWNVRSTLVVETINNIMNINPTSQDMGLLPQNNYVCLWGIGCGGAEESFGNVRTVHFNEREIATNGNGLTEMLPFRVVDVALDPATTQYFLKKQVTTLDGASHLAYYGKVFDKDSTKIYTRWRNGAEGEDGTLIENGTQVLASNDDIETYVEMHLTLAKTDLREWFEYNGQIEAARINTIGLFTAKKVGDEYVDVKLFSKFNFDNEALSNKKEINFTYRIYVS